MTKGNGYLSLLSLLLIGFEYVLCNFLFVVSIVRCLLNSCLLMLFYGECVDINIGTGNRHK